MSFEAKQASFSLKVNQLECHRSLSLPHIIPLRTVLRSFTPNWASTKQPLPSFWIGTSSSILQIFVESLHADAGFTRTLFAQALKLKNHELSIRPKVMQFRALEASFLQVFYLISAPCSSFSLWVDCKCIDITCTFIWFS